MPEWLKFAAENGVGWVLLAVILWFGGKWLGKWLTTVQQFQHNLVLKSAEQQKDMSTAWLAMLGEVEATNKDFAAALRTLGETVRENGALQASAIEKVCMQLGVHETSSSQRDEIVASLLRQLVETQRTR